MIERIKSWNFYRTGLLAVLLSFLVTATVADPIYYPGTGNHYEFVGGNMHWQDAVLLAESLEFQGQPGHLATVTSLDENEFIASTFASGQADFFAWLAGYEPDDDGTWFWGAGPEDGTQFSDDGTATPPFFFVNWGGEEPNDHSEGEDYLAINLGDEFAGVYPGEWIDSPNPNPSDPILGLIVEYEDIASAIDPDDDNETMMRLLRLDVVPNPFNPATTVSFELPMSVPAQLGIYDIRGHRLRTLVDGNLDAGVHAITWDGRDGTGQRVASGMYYCRLVAGEALITGKLILLK
jgi:hypothetical protein